MESTLNKANRNNKRTFGMKTPMTTKLLIFNRPGKTWSNKQKGIEIWLVREELTQKGGNLQDQNKSDRIPFLNFNELRPGSQDPGY